MNRRTIHLIVSGVLPTPSRTYGPPGERDGGTGSWFSGCGALDLALLPRCTRLRIDAASRSGCVSRTCVHDGSLPADLVFPDVRLVTSEALFRQDPRGQVSQRPLDEAPGVVVGALSSGQSIPKANSMLGLVYGFPCTRPLEGGFAGGRGRARRPLCLRSAPHR